MIGIFYACIFCTFFSVLGQATFISLNLVFINMSLCNSYRQPEIDPVDRQNISCRVTHVRYSFLKQAASSVAHLQQRRLPIPFTPWRPPPSPVSSGPDTTSSPLSIPWFGIARPPPLHEPSPADSSAAARILLRTPSQPREQSGSSQREVSVKGQYKMKKQEGNNLITENVFTLRCLFATSSKIRDRKSVV